MGLRQGDKERRAEKIPKKSVFRAGNAGMNPYLCTPFVSSRTNPGGQAESLLFIHF